jgi:hypothetical protein
VDNVNDLSHPEFAWKNRDTEARKLTQGHSECDSDAPPKSESFKSPSHSQKMLLLFQYVANQLQSHGGECRNVNSFCTSIYNDYFNIKQTTDNIRGPSEKSVDWRQCAALMQREAVTVMPICSGEGNVVVA